MALSLSNFLYICSSFFFVAFASAETRTYDFSVGWVTRNPDGLYDRPTIAINGQWPIPRIEANIFDRIIVNVHNNLGNQSTSLHFHGLFMNGTNEMDGVIGGTQCEIPPGYSFTYNFTIEQPGTYWYHSHSYGQYPDGIRGPLIIHDPENPFKDQYDEELVLTLSDWYHKEMPALIKSFISVTNPTGAEPVPNSALMNDTQNLQIHVQPGKTYMLRLINMAAFAGQYFWIEGHTLRVIEVDGVYTEPTEATMIYIATAQRYSFLLTMKNETSKNYAMVGSMDQTLFDTVPTSLNPNVTSFLVYNTDVPLPTPALLDAFDPFDDMTLIPYDHQELLTDPDLSINLAVVMNNLGNGANYAFFNDITYVRPVVPSIFTAMTTGDLAADPTVYGVNTNPFVLGHNEVVEIVVNNHDSGRHPFHLHGFNFQATTRGEENAGDYDPSNTTLNQVPMRRDTLLIYPYSHFVVRFRSNNPGIWLFHCHIEWHVVSGLIATLVTAPLEMQQRLTIPADHYAACSALNTPVEGNAAGNTVDPLDLTGANVQPAPLPSGFQPRGIVALVFSCLAGILGIIVIAWYGMGEMGEIEKKKELRAIDRMAMEKGVDGLGRSEGTNMGDK